MTCSVCNETVEVKPYLYFTQCSVCKTIKLNDTFNITNNDELIENIKFLIANAGSEEFVCFCKSEYAGDMKAKSGLHIFNEMLRNYRDNTQDSKIKDLCYTCLKLEYKFDEVKENIKDVIKSIVTVLGTELNPEEIDMLLSIIIPEYEVVTKVNLTVYTSEVSGYLNILWNIHNELLYGSDYMPTVENEYGLLCKKLKEEVNATLLSVAIVVGILCISLVIAATLYKLRFYVYVIMGLFFLGVAVYSTNEILKGTEPPALTSKLQALRRQMNFWYEPQGLYKED